jgi:hypothetical protein
LADQKRVACSGTRPFLFAARCGKLPIRSGSEEAWQMRKLVATAAMVSLLALGACGRGDDKAAGLTAEENRQLDNAAEMLDTSPDSLVPADNQALGNGEEASMDAIGENGAGANAQ